jgi:hypothetical protein
LDFECHDENGITKVLKYTRFAYPGTSDWSQLRAKKKDPRKQSVVDHTVVNNDPADCADTDVRERQATNEELTTPSVPEGETRPKPKFNSECSWELQDHD